MGRACAVVICVTASLFGCVRDSESPLVFDPYVDSIVVENRLFAPVVLIEFRSGSDTIAPRETRTLLIQEEGARQYYWHSLRVLGDSAQGLGTTVEGNAEFLVESTGVLTLRSDAHGHPAITPRIENRTSDTLFWTHTSYGPDNESPAGVAIPPGSETRLDHLQYESFWAKTRVVLQRGRFGRRYTIATRPRDGELRLELDTRPEFEGSGLTKPIIIE